jgi:Putative quorum-sensing-regulated virulence factor
MNLPKKISLMSQALTWNKRLAVSEYTTRRLTFGKYINIMIKDLPIDYLEWGVLNFNNSWGEYFLREWKRRNPNWRKIIP